MSEQGKRAVTWPELLKAEVDESLAMVQPEHVWGTSPVEPLDLDHAAIIGRRRGKSDHAGQVTLETLKGSTYAGHDGRIIEVDLDQMMPWNHSTHP